MLSDDKQHFKLKCGEIGQGRLFFLKRDLVVYSMLRTKNVPIQKGPSEGVMLMLIVPSPCPSPWGLCTLNISASLLHVEVSHHGLLQHNSETVKLQEFYFKFAEKRAVALGRWGGSISAGPKGKQRIAPVYVCGVFVSTARNEALLERFYCGSLELGALGQHTGKVVVLSSPTLCAQRWQYWEWCLRSDGKSLWVMEMWTEDILIFFS